MTSFSKEGIMKFLPFLPFVEESLRVDRETHRCYKKDQKIDVLTFLLLSYLMRLAKKIWRLCFKRRMGSSTQTKAARS